MLTWTAWGLLGATTGGHNTCSAEDSAAASAATVENASEPVAVDLFQAMEAGDLEVKLIPKDSTQSTVLIENKSDRPLRIRLPEAFAGVPVLAQDFGNDRGGLGRGGGNNNSNQSFGGGMGGMGGMGMGMGGMGGMFNVAPAAVRKLKVKTVCLEHGKPDPNPRIPYALKPLESVTQDGKVIELCKMLGRNEIDQHAAQAAAWHLTDGLTWPQLLAKIKVRHLNGATETYFTRRDLNRAMLVVQEAGRRSEEQSGSKSPVETSSATYYRQ
jgi:hypothetical protein